MHPSPKNETFFFVFALPHQPVTPFLIGAPPPKKNPGSALLQCSHWAYTVFHIPSLMRSADDVVTFLLLKDSSGLHMTGIGY